MPQHGTSTAQGAIVVTPPQAISVVNMAELKEWFATNNFPQEVLTRLLVPNPRETFPGISDVEDLGYLDESELTLCGLPRTEFERWYRVVRTDRAVSRLCREGHRLFVVNGLPSYYSRLGWQCDLCSRDLERDASRVLHCTCILLHLQLDALPSF
jgi:hypothetical protein